MIYDLEGLVNAAIELNARNRRVEFRLAMSPTEYAFQFCTVHLNVGRGSGKSSVITRLAQVDDVIIAHNYQAAESFKRGKVSTPATILAASYLDGPRWLSHEEDRRARSARRIFIDEPRLVDRAASLERIYSLLVNQQIDQTFILLGE